MVLLGSVKFYIIVLLVNNYNDDVRVTTTLAAPYESFVMKPGDRMVISEQPSNQEPVIITAEDFTTRMLVDLNGQSSVSLEPRKNFGYLEVAYIGEETIGILF